MRIYWNSIAFVLLNNILLFGNLPYDVLKLMVSLGRYEALKDAVQKLIRAGYVGVVKKCNVKSLYVTPQGMEACNKVLERRGEELWEEREPIVYNADKAERVDRINAARLLFTVAGYEDGEDYLDSRFIKQEAEENAARASDNLKYSRFVGFWHTGDELGMIVYNFGKHNQYLNPNGETNIWFHMNRKLDETLNNPLPMLILGANMDTMLEILIHTEWWYAKSKQTRKRIPRTRFYLNMDSSRADYTYFLPIDRLAIPILKMMHDPNWEMMVGDLYSHFMLTYNRHVAWGLGCQLKHFYLNHSCRDYNRGEKVLVVCYDWQLAMVEAYYGEIIGHKEVWIQVYDIKTVEDFFWSRRDKLPYDPYKLEENK